MAHNDEFGSRYRVPSIEDLQRDGLLPRYRMPRPFLGSVPLIDYADVEQRVLAWASPSRVIPPMLKPATVVPAEPESASVQVLRALLADRREVKRNAESSHKSRIRQAEDAERRAADLRKRAEDDTQTVEQADAEIAAVLADIEKLSGRPEAA